MEVILEGKCGKKKKSLVVRILLLLLFLLLTGSHNLLHLAVFCQDDRLRTHFTNIWNSLQNRAFPGKLRRMITMIKILFICHGTPVL